MPETTPLPPPTPPTPPKPPVDHYIYKFIRLFFKKEVSISMVSGIIVSIVSILLGLDAKWMYVLVPLLTFSFVILSVSFNRLKMENEDFAKKCDHLEQQVYIVTTIMETAIAAVTPAVQAEMKALAVKITNMLFSRK